MDKLYSAPCFVINMDRCKERYTTTYKNIIDAGYKNITRFHGVDALKSDELTNAWKYHNNPKFNEDDTDFIHTYLGKQGCAVSHFNLWKYIIENNIEICTVFEDDVCFHKDWNILAEKYIQATPNDYDILYIGSQIDFMIDSHIIVTPVFCTHSYVITLEGAKKLYKLVMNYEKGIYTIDCMIIDFMKEYLMKKSPKPFTWYVWNGTMFHDPRAEKDPDWKKRNAGLVFQDASFISDVRIWK